MECLNYHPAHKAWGPLGESQRLDWTGVRQCLQDIHDSCHSELLAAVPAFSASTQDQAIQHFNTEGEPCLEHLPLTEEILPVMASEREESSFLFSF